MTSKEFDLTDGGNTIIGIKPGRAIDRTCRCNGGCPYCEQNRLHADQQREQAAKEQVAEYEETPKEPK